ncbi:MAG: 50S ribosomal protein L9 [Phycisphaerae bacterium]|nr:50S ribosomal protein L9 [Phycisphaerae bacterium]MDD5380458.1 50S ribosomal protein L9 [Phycisphaerae bacterium]
MQKKENSNKASTSDAVKVLLCEDVKDLGWFGDVVEVSTGYARNYLLPQRLATVPTKGNLRSLAKETAKRSEQRKLERKRLEEVSAAVEGAEAVVAAKANEQGVLFGSIGAGEIAENLRAQGFKITDEMVRLTEHIKQVGTHKVTLKFDKDLTATVNVTIVAESAEGETAPPAGEANKPQDENKPDGQSE